MTLFWQEKGSDVQSEPYGINLLPIRFCVPTAAERKMDEQL